MDLHQLPSEVPRIGPYRFLYPFLLLARAGKGGMGDVYEGWNINHLRRVAVKIKNRGGTAERLYHEALLGFRDLGPHVVRAYDVHRQGQLDFLELEWVEGRNLEQLAGAGELTEREIWSLAQQICAGLGALHALGAVHRDIKPSNVLVACDGVAKVSDLGIAQSDDALHTQTVGAVGTRSFMSPEQRRGDPALDGRSDIYSLGMTLYALLGRFYADGRAGDLYKLASVGAPPSLGTLAPDVHPELARIVDWCLAQDREQRPRDTAELGAALRGVPWTLTQVRFAPRQSIPPEPAPELVHAARKWWAQRRDEVGAAPEILPHHRPPDRTPAQQFESSGSATPEVIDDAPGAGSAAVPRTTPGRRLTVGLAAALVALVGAYAFVPPLRHSTEPSTGGSSDAAELGQRPKEPPSPGDTEHPGPSPAPESAGEPATTQVEPIDREVEHADPGPTEAGSEQPVPQSAPSAASQGAAPPENARDESPELAAPPAVDEPPPGFEFVSAEPDAPRYYRPLLTRSLDSHHGLRFVRVGDLLVQEVEVARCVWSEVLGEDLSELRLAERFLPRTRVSLGDAERFVAALNALVPSEYPHRFAIPTAGAMERIHAAAAGLPGQRLEALAPPGPPPKPGEDPKRTRGPYKPTGDVRVELQSTLDAPSPPPLGLKWLLGNVRELTRSEPLGTVVRFGGSERDRASRELLVGHRTPPEPGQSSDGWDGLRLIIELPRQ